MRGSPLHAGSSDGGSGGRFSGVVGSVGGSGRSAPTVAGSGSGVRGGRRDGSPAREQRAMTSSEAGHPMLRISQPDVSTSDLGTSGCARRSPRRPTRSRIQPRTHFKSQQRRGRRGQTGRAPRRLRPHPPRRRRGLGQHIGERFDAEAGAGRDGDVAVVAEHERLGEVARPSSGRKPTCRRGA